MSSGVTAIAISQMTGHHFEVIHSPNVSDTWLDWAYHELDSSNGLGLTSGQVERLGALLEDVVLDGHGCSVSQNGWEEVRVK